MSALAQAAKVIMLVVGLHVGAYHEGDGAFYHKVNMKQVAILRNERRWLPEGVTLDPDWDCLAAWGLHEPEMLGKFILADLPGGGWRI